jgi:branched-chain amino acid transport system ATP-binding protein
VVLDVREIVTNYGAIRALKGVSFRIGSKEIVTILGANGAGKSTIMRTLSGLTPPIRGTIEFLGQRIERNPPEKIVQRGISQVPEGREIFPELTVKENLRMGAFIRKDRNAIQEDMKRMEEYFPILGQRQNQLAGTLSGGEQQMLAIGRGLMAQPKLLLLDEPSMGLAPIIVEEIFDIIKRINEIGTTILLVEQNAYMALHIAARGYILENGRVILSGTAAELLENREISKAYLGAL